MRTVASSRSLGWTQLQKLECLADDSLDMRGALYQLPTCPRRAVSAYARQLGADATADGCRCVGAGSASADGVPNDTANTSTGNSAERDITCAR